MIRPQPPLFEVDWWDLDAVTRWLDAYPCGFCVARGANFEGPGSEGQFADLICRACGACVGRLPWPPEGWIEFAVREGW